MRGSPFGLMALFFVFCLLSQIPFIGDNGSHPPIPAPAPTLAKAEPALPAREVTIDYRIRYGWIYTGTSDVEREYRGSLHVPLTRDSYVWNRHDVALYQAPTMLDFPITEGGQPESLAINFATDSGLHCKAHVGIVDGAVECPQGGSYENGFHPTSTQVFHPSPNHYIVWIAPQETLKHMS